MVLVSTSLRKKSLTPKTMILLTRKKNILRFFLPALFVIFFLTGCGKDLKPISLEGLKPEIVSLVPKLKNIDLYGIELEFTTEVMNPYPVSVSNAEFHYSLEIMGSEFIAAEVPITTKLKASQTSTFSFPVRIEFLKVSEVLKDYKNMKEASYLLKGSLKFPHEEKNFEIPVQKEGNFPLFHMPEFHNVKIDSTDPSFFNFGITVTANLKNTNGFPLGVHGLRYAMTVGDITVGELKVHTDRSIEPGRLGKITIIGKISAAGTIMDLFNGKEVGTPKLEASGSIDTPYGKIKIKPPKNTEE